MAFWPTSISTNAGLYIAVNALQTTLSGSIDNVVTTITLASTTNFPTAGAVTIDNEVIFYTGISGAQLTGCTRGADGTTAASHSSGVPVGATVVAAHHNLLKDEIIALETSLDFTVSRAMTSDGSGRLAVSAVTTTELGYVSGVTSAIQTQFTGKKTIATGNAYKFETTDSGGSLQETTVTASRAVATDANGLPVASATTATELGYVNGVTSAIQTQLGTKAPTASPTFTGTVTLPNLLATDTSNQLVLGTTRTITITAPTPATSSRTWTLPDLATSPTFAALEAAQTFSGAKTFSATLTMSGATIAMGNQKITGLAAGTANGDAVRFEQLPSNFGYRRPVLVFGSVTTVTGELGNSPSQSTSASTIVFPDGTVVADATTKDITFDITRNAVLAGGGSTPQGGLRTSLSEATNTWYALYAVKQTDDTTRWCLVGDTVLPLVANYATLNSSYQTNGWIYLGLIRNGDRSGATGDIITFVQHGNLIEFNNECTGSSVNGIGLRLANSAGATSTTFTYAAGTGSAQIPNNVLILQYTAICGSNPGTNFSVRAQTSNTINYRRGSETATVGCIMLPPISATLGLNLATTNSVAHDIFLSGFIDQALGLGSNPLV